MGQAEQQGIHVKPVAEIDWQVLDHELEIRRSKKMAELPEELVEAAKREHRIGLPAMPWSWQAYSTHTTRTVMSSGNRRKSGMPGWHWLSVYAQY